MADLLESGALHILRDFFNNQHDKLLVTANKHGEPNIALMGTPRLLPPGIIKFEISDRISVTLNNIQENNAVLFLTYIPGQRARDYFGARVYAKVTEIITSGEKLQEIREGIRIKHGDEKADELQATVTCLITRVRPIVDRGQQWNESPFNDSQAQ